MASSALPMVESGKEVAENPMKESIGLEVDSRGIELAPAAPHSELHSHPHPSFWRRWRYWILGVVIVCVVAAIVGGAVGATTGEHHSSNGSSSPTSTTSSTTSTPSSAGTAMMTGSASLQLAPYAYPTPISSLGPGTIDIYMLGIDGSIYSKEYINSSWQPSASTFYPLYGNNFISTNIAAVSRSIGETDLFVRNGSDSYIYHKRRVSSGSPPTWYPSPGPWQPTYVSSLSYPEAISSSSSRVVFQFFGGDNILYAWSWIESPSTPTTSSNRSTWHWLGAHDGATHNWLNYTPTLVSWGPDRIDFFGVRAGDNALYHRFADAHGWQPQDSFQKLGGYCTGRPIAVSPAAGRIFVFVRGGDARLWYISYDDAVSQNWSAFSPLGNITIAAEPHAVSWAANRIDVLVWGDTDHAIRHASYDGQTWTAWESLGEDLAGPPKAVSKGSGQLDVFVIGRKGQLMRRAWDEGRGSWEPVEGWEDLGTPGSGTVG